MKKLLLHKDAGAEGVVVALVLIVVAVALCLVFRTQIAGILDNGLCRTNTAVNNIFQWGTDNSSTPAGDGG